VPAYHTRAHPKKLRENVLLHPLFHGMEAEANAGEQLFHALTMPPHHPTPIHRRTRCSYPTLMSHAHEPRPQVRPAVLAHTRPPSPPLQPAPPPSPHPETQAMLAKMNNMHLQIQAMQQKQQEHKNILCGAVQTALEHVLELQHSVDTWQAQQHSSVHAAEQVHANMGLLRQELVQQQENTAAVEQNLTCAQNTALHTLYSQIHTCVGVTDPQSLLDIKTQIRAMLQYLHAGGATPATYPR